MDPGAFESLMERLATERKRLEQLRSDYATITNSRFHALRMLWFSFKTLVKRDSSGDRYAVWSRGIAPGTGLSAQVEISHGRALSPHEQHLVESWISQTRPWAPTELPNVSIVLPVYNHRDVTVRCLQSIADTWPKTLRLQVIIVDDGSSDTMADLASRMAGIDYIRSCRNEGFIRACNLGAAMAFGKYIFFLNNDTIVRDGAIDHLVSTAEEDSTIGVVGAKLVYPDGRLQEAGSIMWRDASGWNYGRFDSPEDPRYNYVRDVDYVSGAALLVRAALFRELGGFDNGLQRAYYEDVDLCFGVRRLGYRVVYQPLSEVVHLEGASSPNEMSGMKRYQEINQPRFREKWAAELRHHLYNSPANVPAAARRLKRGPVVLVVDTHVPLYDRDAGSSRLMHIIRILRTLEYHVMFLPDNYAGLQPYTEELQQLGVEVLHHIEGGRPMEDALAEVLPFIDYAWLSRPDTYQKYEPLIRRNGRIRLIYDTVDLHFMRKRREAELRGGDQTESEQWQRLELEAAHNADATVVVTDEEKAVLEALDVGNVYVIPTIHPLEVTAKRDPNKASGVLFIGNYNHEPNIDACVWLATEIMPSVWKKLPKVVLTVVGANPSERILELEAERVRVSGYVPDVTPYFTQSRIFAAPLRYGAGMKGKIGQALSYRLPVITTPTGAEGFGLQNGEHFLVVPAEADAFADAIIHLYRDEAQWKHLSDASESALLAFSPAAVTPRLRSMMEDVGRKNTGELWLSRGNG